MIKQMSLYFPEQLKNSFLPLLHFFFFLVKVPVKRSRQQLQKLRPPLGLQGRMCVCGLETHIVL